ncbi:hypothetical protein GCM10022275_28650 [Tessaracoccus defluvii]
MRTSDWDVPAPARIVSLDPAGWDELKIGYCGRLNDLPLLRCFQVAELSGARCAVIETRYLGPDYRREYSRLHSRTFPHVPDWAHRIHFFDSELDVSQLTTLPDEVGYLGYVVVRPPRLSAVVKAMLVPPPDLRLAVRTAVAETIHLFGQELSVVAVPFAEQDTTLGVCAHAAAWSCHYTAALRRYCAPLTIAELAETADASLSPHRAFPNQGLTVQQLSDLFRRHGTPPMFYMIGMLPHAELPGQFPPPAGVPGADPGTWDTRIVSTACRHLNGGFPVLVGTRDHAFVLCGWWREAGQIRLVRHDDQQGPYLPVNDPLNDSLIHPVTGAPRDYGPWRTLHVPMPPTAWLLPEAAEKKAGVGLLAGSSALASPLATKLSQEVPSLADLAAQSALTFRTYVARSCDYKAALAARGHSNATVAMLRLTQMPRFVVVVEAVDRNARQADGPCVVAEAVMDATSSDRDPSWIAAWVHGATCILEDPDDPLAVRSASAPTRVLSGGVGPA